MGEKDARSQGDRLLHCTGVENIKRFTYDEYRNILLRLTNAGYKFVPYGEPAEAPVCHLRHDLDVSISKAIELAEIEKEFNIRSTFCVMLRTNAYNPFSLENSNYVRRLLDCGHFIGLHFDCSAYGQELTFHETRELCLQEAGILSKWFGYDVKMISFHKPNAMVLSGLPELTAPLPHAYERRFMRDMTYLSDSYGFWRYGHPLLSRAFSDRESLSLAMHPIWWNEYEWSPLYSLKQSMIKRRNEIREYMLTNIVGV